MTASTVLVVEDDQPLKEALVSTLETAGFDVLSAGDGGEALAIVDGARVDLVVTDVQMQPVDGRELLRRLKHDDPTLPVLLMTAFGTIEQAVTAMQEGAADYLVKPFEARELERYVQRYLRPPPAGGEGSGVIAADPRTRSLLRLAIGHETAPGEPREVQIWLASWGVPGAQTKAVVKACEELLDAILGRAPDALSA